MIGRDDAGGELLLWIVFAALGVDQATTCAKTAAL